LLAIITDGAVIAKDGWGAVLEGLFTWFDKYILKVRTISY